jgi:23S rRNA (uracil1939-C5)-methyltransferase
VVFDPKQQGAQAQVKQLAAKIPVAIAASRNVATFARDARTLIDDSYKIASVTPVDQFRHRPRRIGRMPKR